MMLIMVSYAWLYPPAYVIHIADHCIMSVNIVSITYYDHKLFLAIAPKLMCIVEVGTMIFHYHSPNYNQKH